MAEDAPACATLWIGPRLTATERACMRSVTAQGHPLTLYTYGEVEGVPEGVVLADAREVLPQEALIAHRSGSYALFSDRFRFELQRQGKGIWLDADVYLLKPLVWSPQAGPLFGWSEPGLIGAGLLGLPSDSPIIAPVVRLFERPYLPRWLRRRDRVRAGLRALRHRGIDLTHLPWGVAGPLAVTWLADRHGMAGQAAARSVFYPYCWREAEWIFNPTRSLSEFVRPETIALHLYNHMIAARKEEAPAPGSFFARLCAEGA